MTVTFDSGGTSDSQLKAGVEAFKTRYCDENDIIAEILLRSVKPFLSDPILDVGCGLGDISADAFGDREVILLDRIAFEPGITSKRHRRVCGDFFEFDPAVQPRTLVFCHSLQYLDADIPSLDAKVRALAARNIVTVLNSYDEVMGEILKWAAAHIDGINPEVHIPSFPGREYDPSGVWPFVATVTCPSFAVLAQQVAYLLDTPGKCLAGLERLVRRILPQPTLTMNQSIELYRAKHV